MNPYSVVNSLLTSLSGLSMGACILDLANLCCSSSNSAIKLSESQAVTNPGDLHMSTRPKNDTVIMHIAGLPL